MTIVQFVRHIGVQLKVPQCSSQETAIVPILEKRVMPVLHVTPAAKPAPKRDRLHLRLDLSSRNKIEQAAYYLNKTASEFVLVQAVAAADEVIKAHRHTLTLSESDWDQFCQALSAPPKPNSKLKAAARRYAKRGGALVG